MTTSTIDLRPADERFHTELDWLDSHHSFSFGRHYDPANVGHGLLIVSNDDIVAPGGGFGTHGHRDMEIVTWVLEGRLEHRDSAGNHGVLYPGLAQRMSAGLGIRHSETNPSTSEPVHFVQMWVVPDRVGVYPSYEQLDVNDALAGGELVAVASGRNHEGAIAIQQSGAVMWVARLEEGRTVRVPDAPFVHVFVATGTARLDSHQLGPGDAARLREAGPLELAGETGAEVIVWESNMEVPR